jgi:hypothetical protein
MQDPFAQAMITFSAHIDELRQNLYFINHAIKLRPMLASIVDRSNGRTPGTIAVDTFCKLHYTQNRVVVNGLYVTLIASFEELLRNLLRIAIQERVKQVDKYSDLGEKLMKRHIEYTGKILANIHKPPAHLSLDYYEICRKIGTCFPDAVTFEINETAFSIINAITDLQNFFECIEVIGFTISWDDIGRDERLQQFFTLTGTRETQKEIHIYLDNAIRHRNRIAHTGQSVADITDDEIHECISFFELLSECIVVHLNSKIITVQTQRRKPRK